MSGSSKLTHFTRLDSKGVFGKGFSNLATKLHSRLYTTVLEFSTDFGAVIQEVMSSSTGTELLEDKPELNGESPNKNKIKPAKTRIALAKRVIKAVQGPLEDAIRKESQLSRQPFEGDIQRLGTLLQKGLASTYQNTHEREVEEPKDHEMKHANDLSYENSPIEDARILETNALHPANTDVPLPSGSSAKSNGLMGHSDGVNGGPPISNGIHHGPLNTNGSRPFSTSRGVPWYMESFRPNGTTLEEEQWTGRDLVRGMSEDLSDMDEEEMSGLINADGDTEMTNNELDKEQVAMAAAAAKKRKAINIKRKKGRRYR